MKRCTTYLTGWLLVAALLVGCGKHIPDDIIQPDSMENLLYDYHLSLAMGGNLAYGENYQKEAYRTYVLEKHGVTPALFDSSMVWYTRHTEELATLYKNVGERFRREKQHTEQLLALRENKPVTSAPGDTVDIWYDRKLYWLTSAPLSKRISFDIPADSNFYLRDRFVWSADYAFLSKGRCSATMGFNVFYENDSVQGTVVTVSRSGSQVLTIQTDSASAVRKVTGFVDYVANGLESADPGLILNRLTLMRYHWMDTDSLAEDVRAQVLPSGEQVNTPVARPSEQSHQGERIKRR